MQKDVILGLVFAGVVLCAQQQPPPGTRPEQRPPTGVSDPAENPPPGKMDKMDKSDKMMSKSSDTKFVKDAAIGGLAEVQLGSWPPKGLERFGETIRPENG